MCSIGISSGSSSTTGAVWQADASMPSAWSLILENQRDSLEFVTCADKLLRVLWSIVTPRDVCNRIEVTVTNISLTVTQEASKQPSLFSQPCEHDGDPRGHAGTEAASCADD